MPHMSFAELEHQVLELPTADRARLADVLLASLDAPTSDQHVRVWGEESARRAAELDIDPTLRLTADEVFRELRAERS